MVGVSLSEFISLLERAILKIFLFIVSLAFLGTMPNAMASGDENASGGGEPTLLETTDQKESITTDQTKKQSVGRKHSSTSQASTNRKVSSDEGDKGSIIKDCGEGYCVEGCCIGLNVLCHIGYCILFCPSV